MLYFPKIKLWSERPIGGRHLILDNFVEFRVKIKSKILTFLVGKFTHCVMGCIFASKSSNISSCFPLRLFVKIGNALGKLKSPVSKKFSSFSTSNFICFNKDLMV